MNKSNHCLELLSYADIRDYPENSTNSTNYMDANITHYTCYAWTLHIFGVAFASALGVYKLAIVFTTVYIQMSEWCLINCSKCVKYKWISIFVLVICDVICLLYYCYSLSVMLSSKTTYASQAVLTVVSMLVEYTYLPLWVCLGLAVVTWKLEAYCKQTEYCTLSPDQWPPPSQLPEQEHQCESLQVAVTN